jgi:hypothetical protein
MTAPPSLLSGSDTFCHTRSSAERVIHLNAKEKESLWPSCTMTKTPI